jgi:hypothetical protein
LRVAVKVPSTYTVLLKRSIIAVCELQLRVCGSSIKKIHATQPSQGLAEKRVLLQRSFIENGRLGELCSAAGGGSDDARAGGERGGARAAAFAAARASSPAAYALLLLLQRLMDTQRSPRRPHNHATHNLTTTQKEALKAQLKADPKFRAELRERVKAALLDKARGEGFQKAEFNFDSYMLTGAR